MIGAVMLAFDYIMAFLIMYIELYLFKIVDR